MTVIIQEETTGCGIASVANIVDQSYAEVKAKANAFKSWEALPDIALLSIKYHEKNGLLFWHWVVFKRE